MASADLRRITTGYLDEGKTAGNADSVLVKLQGLPLSSSSSSSRGPPLSSTLCVAAFRGQLDPLQTHLAGLCDIDSEPEGQWGSLLHFAACSAFDQKPVNLILRAGAKIDHQDRWGATALLVASCPLECQPERRAWIETAMDAEGIEEKVKRQMMEWATGTTRSLVVECLLNHGADVNLPDCRGLTPLSEMYGIHTI